MLKKWYRFLSKEHQDDINSSKSSEPKSVLRHYFIYLAYPKVGITIGEIDSPVNGIVHSLIRVGKCIDNAHMESFFYSIKTEVIRGYVYKSDAELRGTLGSYINKYYNAIKIHSSIKYCSPMEYEVLAA